MLLLWIFVCQSLTLFSVIHASWPVNLIPARNDIVQRLQRGDCRRVTSSRSSGCTIRCEFFERQAGNPIYEQERLPVIVDNIGNYMSLPPSASSEEGWKFSLTQPANASFGLTLGLKNGQLNVSEEVDYDIRPRPEPSVADVTAADGITSVHCRLIVSVLDFNESPLISVLTKPTLEAVRDIYTEEPQRTAEVFSVREDAPVGTVVVQFDVSDPDDGPGTVTCHSNVTRHLQELEASGFQGPYQRRSLYEWRFKYRSPGDYENTFEEASKVFGIRRSNGSKSRWEIFTRTPLDFESINDRNWQRLQDYELPIFCRGGANESDFSESFLPIKLFDVNEFVPNCTSYVQVHEMSETATVPFTLAIFFCYGVESPIAANLSLHLVGEGVEDMLPIVIDFPWFHRTYPPRIQMVLDVGRPLDYERLSRYDIKIMMTDIAQGKYLSRVASEVTLSVLDEDEPPNFGASEFNISLMENSPPGSSVFKFSASDPDRADVNTTITFESLVVEVDGSSTSPNGPEQNWFYINPSSGELHANRSFNREDLPRIVSLNITAKEQKISGPSHTSVQANIMIVGTNEFNPQFSENHYVFYVKENGGTHELIGALQAEDPDKGKNTGIEYFLASSGGLNDDARLFEMDPVNRSSGRLYSRVSFDREKNDRFEFHVHARDMGEPARTSSVLVTIDIGDVNDSPPQFVSPPRLIAVPPETAAGNILVSFNVSDADAKIPLNVTFSFIPVRSHDREVIPRHFSIDQHGELKVIHPLQDVQARDYPLYVIVSDVDTSKRLTSTATVTLRITAFQSKSTSKGPSPGGPQSSNDNMLAFITSTGCGALLLFLIIVIIVKVRLVRKRRRYQAKTQPGKMVVNPTAFSTASSLNSPTARPSTLLLSGTAGPPHLDSSATANDFMISLERRSGVLCTSVETPQSIGDVAGFFSSWPAASGRKRTGVYDQDRANLTPSSGEGESSSTTQIQRRISVRTNFSSVEHTPMSEDSSLILGQLSTSLPGSQGPISAEASPQRNTMKSRSHGYGTPPQTTASTPQSGQPGVFGSPCTRLHNRHTPPKYINSETASCGSMSTPTSKFQRPSSQLYRQSSTSSGVYGSPGRLSYGSPRQKSYLASETII